MLAGKAFQSLAEVNAKVDDPGHQFYLITTDKTEDMLHTPICGHNRKNTLSKPVNL